MSKTLLVIFVIVFPVTLSAQDSSFVYTRNKKQVYLTSDYLNLGYDPYLSEGGQESRSIQSNDGSYRMQIHPIKDGKVKKIFNSKDSLIATEFLSGEKANSILLPDGRTLNRKKHSSGWSYQHNGRDVVTYKVKRETGRKSVSIRFHDPAYRLIAIQLICLEHASQKLKGSPVLAMVGVALMLALIRTVAAGA